jgi:hypothetical protein
MAIVSTETISPPATVTVRQVADAIRRRQVGYEARHDPLAVFAFVYHNITLDLAERLETKDSGFRDPEWVSRLVIGFAGRYLVAMDAVESGAALRPDGGERLPPSPALTRPWREVVDSMQGGRSYVIEDLLYGMCAHISYDLPLTLVEVGTDNEHLPDFHRINDVLAGKTEEIEDAVAERYHRVLAWLDWIIGNFDEFFSNFGIRVARSVAWYNAMRLQSPGREEALASIERTTGSFIESIRHPEEWWIRWGLAILRVIIPRRRRWPDPEEADSGRATWKKHVHHLRRRPRN